MFSFRPSPGFRKLLAPLAGLAVLAALAGPAIYWAERSSLAEWSRKAERFTPKKADREVFHSPGVVTPASIPADRATIDADDPVVGVESGGRFRAYHLPSMTAKARHVVNDVVGGRAVTVTFCDLDDCVRAFGGDESSLPLPIALAGLADGGMLLSVDGVAYFQRTAEVADPVVKALPPFPYASFPATRTTWGRWKSLHPETDLYVHQAPTPSAPEASPHAAPAR
ncbi:MAG: hypothetical protein BGO49_29695 [Planctomycetales bacterium 71-10]|nr:MAG: hypothetical protein BGO49_29695 [Planctomycetales bacterium 71-10]